MTEISKMPLVDYADVDPDLVSIPVVDLAESVPRRRNKRMLLTDVAIGQKGDPFTWDDLTPEEKNELASNAIVEVTALKDEAIDAKDAAEAAQLAAETAQSNAEGFATDSENSAIAASDSSGTAQGFSIASSNSADASAFSASAASDSADAAAMSAQSASDDADATAADRIAVNALRDSAGVYASDALNSANEAAASALYAAETVGDPNVQIVADNIADIVTVGTNIADVNAVAAIDDDVSIVAAIAADVTNVSDNMATVTNVNDHMTDIEAAPEAADRAEDAADRAEAASGDAEQDRILAEAARNQAAAEANAANAAADRAEAVVVSGDVSFYPAPGKVPVARSTGQIDTNWVKGVQRPAQWLENVSGATGAVFPDDSESKMTPQQMLVFDPVFIPAVLNGEITLFADGVMGVYITNDKKIRLNYYGSFETTQTIAVSDDWVTVSVVSDDNEQDTVSVFFLVNGVAFDVVQVGEFSPMAMRDVLGDAGFRWLFNPGMEYLTNANVNRVTLPGQAIGTVRDIGPNGLNGSQATATARPLAGRVPVGGRRNLLTSTEDITGASYSTVSSIVLGPKEIQVISQSSGNGIYRTVSVIPNTEYTYSLDVKLGTYPAAGYRIAVYNNTGGSFIIAGSDGGITPNSDEYQRASVTFTTPTGCTSIRVYPVRQSSGNQGIGTIYVDRQDLSPGAGNNYQRVGATARDVTEAGVPDVHYAYFDQNDDVISMTLPSSITGGTLIVAGLTGIYVDDNFSASAGTFDVGSTTYTGGPAGLLAATGSPIGVTVVDGQLTTAELEQERKFYIQNGAPDVPVVI